jgi:hypothetical protein
VIIKSKVIESPTILLILKEVIEPKRPNWIDALIDLRINSLGTVHDTR